MILYFYTEARFIEASDGKIYNPIGVQKKKVFSRYLRVFDAVYIVARIKRDNDYIINESEAVEGRNIFVKPIPYYKGFREFLTNYFNIVYSIRDIIKGSPKGTTVHLLRVPGNIGMIAYRFLKRYNCRYGVEVVGDPFDAFKVKFYENFILFLLRYKFYVGLKKIVRNAYSALYVTKGILQKRYPNSNMHFASNVQITEAKIAVNAKTYSGYPEVNLISVGTMEQMYKAPDCAIELVKALREMGVAANLVWIGDGRFRKQMEGLARKYDVGEFVNFTGFISNRAIVEGYLDRSDVFLMLSRSEGLPRAVIEAFARALPAIGTNIGGIPELIEKDLLCEVGNITQMKNNILRLISDEEYYYLISKRNLDKSREYTEDILQSRRDCFYRYLSGG